MLWLLLLISGARDLPSPAEAKVVKRERAEEKRLYTTDDTVYILDGEDVSAEEFNALERDIIGADIKPDGAIIRLEGRSK